MDATGFSSPRSDAFPAGLRVLVVDDDPTWLKILEKMLKKCSYEVTTCGLATEALDLLRERKDGYDIVISDVNMPDMDGFKLLEHVGLEMDLPVIMMSVDGETSRVMKGVQHGACDYLLKPIRMKELRNIWQHVLRKKIHEVRDIENHEGIEEFEMIMNGSSEQSDDFYLLGRKRKEAENEKDNGDQSSLKKARVVWTVDLHQKFVRAVNHIGFDKVGPKKILDLMNVPWLTRENVASHLQKYRLYLSRIQKESDIKASASCTNYLTLPNTFAHKPKSHESDLKISASLPLNGDNYELQKASCSRTGIYHSFGSLGSNMRYSSTFDSTIPTQYSWSQVNEIQFKQEQKSHKIETDNKPVHAVNNSPYATKFKNIPIQGGNTTSFLPFVPITSNTWNTKNQQLTCISKNEVESSQRNVILGKGTSFESSNEDLHAILRRGNLSNLSSSNLMQNKEAAEVPPYLYEALRFDYEYNGDSIEYPVIDEGLFIA